MRAKLWFSFAYHSQTDGQNKVLNKSLGNLLRCLVGDHPRTWDLVFPLAEFTYNNSVNRSIGMSPFQAIIGYKPRTLVDLLPISTMNKRSESAHSFA